MKNFLSLLSVLLFSLSTNIFAEKIVGTLEPYRKTLVKSEIPGIIKEVHHAIGDRVQASDPLIKIDDRDYRLEFQMAQASEKLSAVNYRFLKADYQRYEKLLKTKSITKQVHSKIQKDYQSSLIQTTLSSISTKQAKRKLDKTSITALYTGVVSNGLVDIGDYVSSGDVLLEYVNDSKLRAVFYILQEDYVQFQKGQEVDLQVPSLKNKAIKGQIHLIAPTILEANSGYRMEVIVDNSNRALKANFEIELILAED